MVGATVNKSVYVIIVTYNGMKWIDLCLKSLRNSIHPLNVIVIDNLSADNTFYHIQHEYPEVELINSGANLGFGKANNIGLKIALEKKADYAFLLNQDAFILPETISEIVKIAEVNKDFGLISPIHLIPDTNELEWYFSTYVVPEKCKNFYSDIYRNSVKDIYELPFVNAAAWLINKETLQKVGGFDPLFPHYGEDEDYCNRVLYKNIKIGVAPVAKIYHDIRYRDWELVKFNLKRQLIVSFIELKNIKLSYRYVLLNYIKSKLDRISYLFIFRKWKEMFFVIKLFFTSLKYTRKIHLSRKASKEDLAYLK